MVGDATFFHLKSKSKLSMKLSQYAMLFSSILLIGLFFLPLWNITLEAPQYPTPLGMDIYLTKLGDSNPNDIKNINLMNHYVGMKYIPDHLKEFDIFPWIIGFMIALGLMLAFKNWRIGFLIWFGLMLIFGIIGMYDFYLWEYDYGHNLDPAAAIKFTNPDGSPMAYQPPLFGSKTILNFTAHSYPRSGAYILAVAMLLSLLAYFRSGNKYGLSKGES
jgi:hypothetical protein